MYPYKYENEVIDFVVIRRTGYFFFCIILAVTKLTILPYLADRALHIEGRHRGRQDGRMGPEVELFIIFIEVLWKFCTGTCRIEQLVRRTEERESRASGSRDDH